MIDAVLNITQRKGTKESKNVTKLKSVDSLQLCYGKVGWNSAYLHFHFVS